MSLSLDVCPRRLHDNSKMNVKIIRNKINSNVHQVVPVTVPNWGQVIQEDSGHSTANGGFCKVTVTGPKHSQFQH